MNKELYLENIIKQEQAREMALAKTKTAYKRAERELLRLKDMNKEQMIKFIAEKLISIEQKLDSL